jgi:hypothetical protein
VAYLRYVAKGLREALLCASCERRLGEFESYFANSWFGSHGLPSAIPPELDLPEMRRRGRSVEIEAPMVDYRRFKLFHLSVLWRASVSGREEFRDVHLGPHEDRMRLMLLRGDPGGGADYRIGCCALLRPGTNSIHTGVVGVPQRVRNGGGSAYLSVYAGCLWAVFVSAGAPGWSNVLTPDGALTLSVLDVSGVPRLLSALERAQRRSATR